MSEKEVAGVMVRCGNHIIEHANNDVTAPRPAIDLADELLGQGGHSENEDALNPQDRDKR